MSDSSPSGVGSDQASSAVRVRHGVAVLLQWASRAESRRLIFGPAAEDLSPTDAALLEYLTKNGPSRLSDLATQWDVNKSTMNPHIGRLEAKGLIDRRPDPADRRATLLSTSALGVELQHRIGQAGATAFGEILSGWSAQDRDALGTMLIRFAEELSAATPRLFQTTAPSGRGDAPPDSSDQEQPAQGA